MVFLSLIQMFELQDSKFELQEVEVQALVVQVLEVQALATQALEVQDLVARTQMCWPSSNMEIPISFQYHS